MEKKNSQSTEQVQKKTKHRTMLIFISISLIYFNYLGDCFESGNIILEDKHLDTLRYILSNEIDEYVFFHSFTSFIHSFAHSHSLLYIYRYCVCLGYCSCVNRLFFNFGFGRCCSRFSLPLAQWHSTAQNFYFVLLK